MADRWLTIDEAVDEARVSRSKLYHWMRHEGLPFFDDGERQIQLSTLLQFKRDKEIVMVRGKKVPAHRAKVDSAVTEQRRLAKASAASKKARAAVAAQRANVARLTGNGDRDSLQAVLDAARKAA